jgi:hypothetical protein
MEMLFMELLFIIRPGAPDHGAAGAPLLVLLIIRLLFIITALQMALLVCLVPAPVYHSPSSCCLCLWSCCL